MEYLLRYLGMGRFTRAMMWVLHHELGLNENCLIAKPDKRRGQLLLEDILVGGNFGRFYQNQEYRLYSKSPPLYKIKRNVRFFWLFSMESFISPAISKLCNKD